MQGYTSHDGLATTARTKAEYFDKAEYFEESEHNGLLSNFKVKAKFNINMGSIIVLDRH